MNEELEKALATIKNVEQSIADHSEVIKQLEKSIKTKDDVITIIQAKINSLEMEVVNKDFQMAEKDGQISKFKRVVMNMAETVNKIKLVRWRCGRWKW